MAKLVMVVNRMLDVGVRPGLLWGIIQQRVEKRDQGCCGLQPGRRKQQFAQANSGLTTSGCCTKQQKRAGTGGLTRDSWQARP